MNNILHAQGMPGTRAWEQQAHFRSQDSLKPFRVLFPQSFSIFWSIWLSGLKKLSVPKSWRQEDLDFSLFTDCKPPSLQVHALKSCSAGGAESVDPVDATVDNATF